MKPTIRYSVVSLATLLFLVLLCCCLLLTGAMHQTAVAQAGCLASGDQNTIKARLDQTGHADLCPNAVFNLSGTIFLSQNQEIYTVGNPTDDSRALLQIAADSYIDPVSGPHKLSMAIQAKNQSNINIHHIRVFGNLPEFGRLFPGDALIELGGASIDQKVQFVKSYEPRSWTALHIFEAPAGEVCRNAQILDNEIGPSGHSDGNYADGISLGCPNSAVLRNIIVDTTDGAIVLFGAHGSIVSNNTIIARHRTLTGGINLVDPGDYSGLEVRNNTIIAEGAQIKVGIQVGNSLLTCSSPQDSSGGIIEGNVFQGPFMGYGIAVSGASNFTITGNTSTATHSGMPTIGCRAGQEVNDPPAFQGDAPKAFLRNNGNTSGTFQADFQSAQLDARPIFLEPDPSSPNWARVPGENIFTSGPGVATAPDGSVYLASRGTADGAYFVYYTHPNFQDYSSQWENVLPQKATADRPAPVFDSTGKLRIYIRDINNEIQRNVLQGTNWLGWSVVTGNRTTQSAPVAVLFNGQVNLLIRGDDNLIYHRLDEDGADPTWYAMTGNLTTLSEPGAAVQGNKLYVVVRNYPEQSLSLNTITSSWDNSSGWILLGGFTPSAPAAVVGPDGNLRIYARGQNNRLYVGNMLGNSWTGLSESFPSIETLWTPAAAMHQGSVRLFITGQPTPGAGAFWSRNTDGIGLVGHWQFDENTGSTTADSSGNGHPGTLTSGATWGVGQSGSAVSLDGGNDYVQVGAQSSLSITNAGSFTAWIYPTGQGSHSTYGGTIVGKEGEYLINRAANGHLYWAFSNGNPGWAWHDTGITVSLNQWTHVAVVYDTGVIKTYINGALMETYSGSGSITDADNGAYNDFRIGSRQNSVQHFQGGIDEVRAYNRALSASEVSAFVGTSGSGPIGYWKFDENTGSTTADSSGNGHPGTLTSGATWGVGQSGSAVSLDGGNDYVQVGAQSSLSITNAGSFTAWIYPTGQGSHSTYGGTIIGKEGEYLINRAANGHLYWAFSNGNPGWAWHDTGITVSLNQWTHVAVVYDAGVIKTYINGALMETYSGSGSITDADNGAYNDFRIGSRQDSVQHFQGGIDEVRAYNRALSASEVSAFVGTSGSGPIGYWKFDENTGSTTADSSGNGHPGTLTSGATWGVGQSGSAVSLDGGNDYVQVGAQSSLSITNAGSFTAWIYPTGQGSHSTYGGTIVGKEGEYLINRAANGHLYWAFSNGNPGWAWHDTGITVSLNQWTHVAVVYDAGVIKTYINGALMETYSGSGSITDADNGAYNDFRIGSRQDSVQHFQGGIDEVRAYNRALSATEIMTLGGGG